MLNLLQYIVYSNIWVALCAAALTAQTFFILHEGDVNVTVVGFAFFATLSAYNFQRIFRRSISDKDELSQRMQWMLKHKTWLRIMTVLSLVATVYLAYFLLASSWPIILGAGIISIFYSSNFTLKNGQKLNLRSIHYLKIFLIAGVWVLITLWIPITWSGSMVPLRAALLESFIRFCFILAVTLPFDIRDIQYDKRDQLKTLATSLGIARTKYLANLLLLVSSVFVWINYVSGYYDVQLMISSIVSFTIAATIISFSGLNRKELFYTGMVESTVLVYSVLTVLFFC